MSTRISGKLCFGRILSALGGALLVLLLASSFPIVEKYASAQAPANPIAITNLFLPAISRNSASIPGDLFLGIYSFRYFNTANDVNQYFGPLDSWAGLSRSAGKGHVISGDFNDLEVGNPDYNVPVPLDNLWNQGFTSFVNLGSPRTAYAYASGQVDASILAWARAYKSWADRGGNRKAFLAPLQEMNGAWTAYGCDPVNYKLAYQHIQDLFMQVGVNRSMAWWVFAPNGWSSPCANNAKIKDYYPGDSRVDIIGFSSYNYGTCPSNSSWQTPEQVFGPYISEIRTTVSNLKPIFIAQTGVTSLGGDKDQWLRDAYKYLANQNVRGVIYFNMDVACNSSTTFNFTVYQPTGFLATGYKDAVNLPYTKYMSPPALATYPFQP